MSLRLKTRPSKCQSRSWGMFVIVRVNSHKMPASALPMQTSEPESARRPLWQQTWLLALLLIALVFVAYARVFTAGFIWDDESHLTQNPCIVGPLGLKEVWTTMRAVYYPLVLTTFWALHRVVGLSPWPYHLLNVLLHAGSALLLWQILRRLSIRGAWLGASLWALHPVIVQSVAWVTELKNTQSCLFYLLSICCFLKWDDAPRIARISLVQNAGNQAEAFPRVPRWRTVPTRRDLMLFVLSLCFFILATLSKPSVVMLPVILALCIWWQTERIQWRDVAAFAPFVLISALASVWTILEQRLHSGATGAEWAQTWPERLIIAGRVMWFYLAKLVWPDPLIFIYPRWKIDPSELTAYLPLLAALTGLLVLWLVRAKWSHAVFFAAAYYVVSLFPVLGFFNVFFFRYSFVSDHFQYLASMGPLALAGAAITTGCTRLAVAVLPRRGAPTSSLSNDAATTPRHLPRRTSSVVATTPFLGLCGVLLLPLVFLTWRQTAIYHDLFTLYTSTLTKNPGCWMAHYNLGIALNDWGETDEAIAHYQQAIELRPGYAEAHYNLGRLLAQKGQLDDAVTHYEKALETDPADAEAQNNLGVTLFGSGRVDEALDHYRKALTIRPDYAEASCNLANALLSKGDLDAAIARYSACLQLSPNQPEAEYDLASALLRKGRTDEAIVHYQKALELRPDSADAHANLGSAFLAKGRVRDAIGEYRNALRISPENMTAQSNLAWSLATSSDSSLRNGPEAVALAEQADSESSRSDNHPIVLRILAAAYAESGRFDEAKQTAQQALQAAEIQGNSTLANALRDEIALYELSLPYHKKQ
jgi:tetratricopeptide (TPR) repeat protein